MLWSVVQVFYICFSSPPSLLFSPLSLPILSHFAPSALSPSSVFCSFVPSLSPSVPCCMRMCIGQEGWSIDGTGTQPSTTETSLWLWFLLLLLLWWWCLLLLLLLLPPLDWHSGTRLSSFQKQLGTTHQALVRPAQRSQVITSVYLPMVTYCIAFTVHCFILLRLDMARGKAINPISTGYGEGLSHKPTFEHYMPTQVGRVRSTRFYPGTGRYVVS